MLFAAICCRSSHRALLEKDKGEKRLKKRYEKTCRNSHYMMQAHNPSMGSKIPYLALFFFAYIQDLASLFGAVPSGSDAYLHIVCAT